jgi:biotin carboxyl carrier protein
LTFEIERGGRQYSVDVHRAVDGWTVATDGHEKFVSIAGLGGRWSLLVGSYVASGFPLTPEAPARLAEARAAREGGSRTSEASGFSRTFKSYELVIESLGPGELRVTVNGHVVSLTVVQPGGVRRRRRLHSGSHGDGPTQIVAPMPGRIVKVLVRPGEQVTARQGLVVVEAMKMENELRAPVAGTVRAVRVSEGATVEANAVLIEID